MESRKTYFKMKEKRIIFSNSYSPRTGHNFASEVLKIITNHEVLAHNRSETRLSIFLNEYYKIYNSKIYHKTDKEFFDTIILSSIRENIINNSNNDFIMIKDTTFEGIEYLGKVFPNDIHIILYRDPRDVFSSLFKAMDLRKRSIKNIIKKVGLISGLYPYYYCKKVSKRIIDHIPKIKTCHYILRYEDLVTKNESVLIELKEKFNSNKSIEQIKQEIDNIHVINSSFYEEVNAKNIWDAKKKTNSFNPINRKKHPFLVQKGIDLGSKRLAKKLNYI